MKRTALPALIAALTLPASLCAETPEAASETALSVDVAYTAERWQNLRGGHRRAGAYLDNLDFVATLDAERGVGMTGTTLSVAALYNNRHTFSDNVGDIQTISNIDTGTNGSLRLYEAWIERAFDRAALKLGLMDLNSEFDLNETGSLFINSSHGIGPEFSQVGENGPSIFPITGLGARLQFDLSRRTRLRIGAFEGTPGDPERPRRTTFELDGDEGALLVAEIAHARDADRRIALGVWQHTGRFHRIAQPADASEHTQARTKRHPIGAYALIEGNLAKLAERDIAGFMRVGVADADVHQIAHHQGAGLVLSGPLLGREQHEEQLGIAVSLITNGSAYRRAQAEAGSLVERIEAAIELTYRVQVTPWLALQPDLQFIVNPGTDPALRNALAVGLRFTWNMLADY